MECTIFSEINLDAPDRTPRSCVSYGILLQSVWRQCQYRCKIGARFAHNAPQAQKPLWKHPIILLGEKAQVEGRFNLFRDSSNIDARQEHSMHGTYHMLRNPFGRIPIELLDDMCRMESRFSLFGDRVSFGARQVHSLRLMHHRLRNHFGYTR